MPSGAKRRKAANNKKKKEKGQGQGPNSNINDDNNNSNYPPSSTHLQLQGEDDSKSQDDRESDNGSLLSQENNDLEHPFDEQDEAPERTDTPSIVSDSTSNAEDPAGGNVVVEDDERSVEVDKEVNILTSGFVDGSVASERKQEEHPSYALSSKASPGIIEKVESQFLEYEKEVETTETAGFEQVMPRVEADKILTSSANDGNEEKGIEDAYTGHPDAVSLDTFEEKDVHSEGTAQILLEKGSVEDANGDLDVNPASQVDLDNPVVPMSDMENPIIDSIDSVEVMEVIEWRLSDNEEKGLQEPSKVNGTSPTVSGLEGNEDQIFPLEEDNVGTSLDEDKTLTSTNEEGDEVFPLVNGNGKTSPDGVDAVISDEENLLIVSKEKEDEPIPVGDDMIESSTVATSATEIVDETKTKTPGADSVDNVGSAESSDVTVGASATEIVDGTKTKTSGADSVDNVGSAEALDVAVKGIEGMLPRLSDSAGTEKAEIDLENKKERSLAAGTQPPPLARPTGLWAFVMSCCGLTEVFGISKR